MVKKCEESCIVGGGEGIEKVFKTCYFVELYLKYEGVEHKTISIPFIGCAWNMLVSCYEYIFHFLSFVFYILTFSFTYRSPIWYFLRLFILVIFIEKLMKFQILHQDFNTLIKIIKPQVT